MPFTRINHQIQAREVRLIDDQGENLGVVSLSEAMKIAVARGLDLVEIGPNAKPPVVRVLDYEKFKYHQQKTATKQKASKLKMVRFSVRTSSHDLETKIRHIKNFFAKGHKVQLHLAMRGREKAHGDFAFEKLNAFLKLIDIEYVVEQPAKRTPMGFIMMIRKK